MTDGRKIIYLLGVGGLMVATTFVFTRIFGEGTWNQWWASNFLHFAGGFYAFFFVRAVYLYTMDRHQTKTAPFMEALMFIAGALALGVFWELFELALDRYRVFIQHLPSIMTYADNIGDLLIDFLGACLAALIYYKRRYKKTD